MGFMDKAKQMAQQVQQEAKDGTLKQRAKTLADQAQAQLDDLQNKAGTSGAGTQVEAPGVDYDQHGRPVAVPEVESATPPAPAAEAPAQPAAPKQAPSSDSGMSSGDPLAG